MGVEAEDRRAREPRVASLEEGMARLLLDRPQVEKERDDLDSFICQGDDKGLLLTQQAEQPGMFFQEKLGLAGDIASPCLKKHGGGGTSGTRLNLRAFASTAAVYLREANSTYMYDNTRHIVPRAAYAVRYVRSG